MPRLMQFLDDWDKRREDVETEYWKSVCCNRTIPEIVMAIAVNLMSPDDFIVRYVCRCFGLMVYRHGALRSAIAVAMTAFPCLEFEYWETVCGNQCGVVLVSATPPDYYLNRLFVEKLFKGKKGKLI